MSTTSRYSYFFFNDPATTEIYTLSLHDALPIWSQRRMRRRRPTRRRWGPFPRPRSRRRGPSRSPRCPPRSRRSEEHTSELQSHSDLVCRLLLEKKKKEKSLVSYHGKQHQREPQR